MKNEILSFLYIFWCYISNYVIIKKKYTSISGRIFSFLSFNMSIPHIQFLINRLGSLLLTTLLHIFRPLELLI